MSADRKQSNIAIIGMACRLPGAEDYRQFWKNLCDGVESVTFFSDEELLEAGVPAATLRDPSYVKAGFVVPGVDRFDAEFFEVSPKETRLMDPQHRVLLEVAWEAFEDAGRCPGSEPQNVGAVVATGGVVTSYLLNELRELPESRGRTANLVHLGNDKDFSSTRLSYKFNLTGPSINVQTACSTSLVALHLACQTIRSGECSMAMTAVATLRVPEVSGYQGQQGSIYSPDGHIRTFDADSKGTVFGSAVAAILLKDYDQAVADGDFIHAVIKGTAVNNDGSDKASYSASSVTGQAGAMLEALKMADTSPDSIGYVECHGTGTVVGDPTEIHALTHAFRKTTDRVDFCPVGSVKPNIGHPEQAAGLASLIKAVEAIKHRQIPPTINLRTLNPRIQFAGSPFHVQTQLGPWPDNGGPRRALVNSLGIGGTNGVVILEEAPVVERGKVEAERPLHVAVFSGKSEQALTDLFDRHRQWLEANPDANLGDVCHTLAAGRAHFSYRAAVTAGSVAELRDTLALGLPTSRVAANRKIGFLFSGQGSQFAGMARDLYATQPVFRSALDRCAAALRPHLDTDLLEILLATDEKAELINQTAYTQPGLFAVEVSIAELLASWGIRPDAVVGHSVGEFAAAHIAGVYTLEEAAKLIAVRGRLMQALPEGGTMAALFADEATALKAIRQAALDPATIGIGALNGPQSTVISGTVEAVNAVIAILEGQGVAARQLRVSHAFHSPLMAPAMPDLRKVVKATPGRAPTLTWISNLTGQVMTAAPSPDYWCDHAMEAVQFSEGVTAMAAAGVTEFIEVGPGKSLLALGQTSAQGEGLAWLATIGREGSAWRELGETVAVLYRRGHAIAWDAFDAPYGLKRMPLPTYAFQRERYWLDRSDQSDGQPDAQRQAAHSPAAVGLPGRRIRSPQREIQFESALSRLSPAWMGDHRVFGKVVLPTTAGLVALLQGASGHLKSEALTVDAFSYRDAMIFGEDEKRATHLLFEPLDDATVGAQLSSAGMDDDAPWRTHMTGTVRRASPSPVGTLNVDAIRDRCGPSIPSDRFYEGLNAIGLTYGPVFRGVRTLWQGRGEVLARVRLPDGVVDDGAAPLHPALLDACLHIYPALIDTYGDFSTVPARPSMLHLPIAIERFAITAKGTREVWAYASQRSVGNDGVVVVDILIHDVEGRPVAALEGLSVKALPAAAFAETEAKADWLYAFRWNAKPLPASTPKGTPASWLILADQGGVGAALADDLRGRGHDCSVLTLSDVANANDMAESPAVFAGALDKLVNAAEGKPTRLVYLWGLDAVLDKDDDQVLQKAQRVALGNALYVVQAVNEARDRHKAVPRVWLVTRNAVSASGDEPPLAIVQGGLWGFGRTVALEAPAIWGGLVDLEAGEGSNIRAAASLSSHLLAADGEEQVAFRVGKRQVARFTRIEKPERKPVTESEEGTWLVTGGLGALGVETAKWLIQGRGVRNIVLASRRGAKDPTAPEITRMLEALGARVTVAKADIGQRNDVKKLLKSLAAATPPLKGIVHSAGVLDDATIPQMTWEKFRRALSPKLDAAWYLHQYSRDLPLAEFVIYSSILSLFGAGGQINYTSANGTLDALVAHRHRLGLPALAINWGPWAAVGLATLSGEQGEAIWRARGLIYIPAEVGAQALGAVVGSNLEQAAVTINDWTAFASQYTTPPRVFEEVLPAPEASGKAEAGPDLGALAAQAQSDNPAERRAAVTSVIAQQVMSTLGLTKAVDTSRPLRELGLDSLMAVTLINRVEAALSVRIPAVTLIQGPSIDHLVDGLWPELKNAGPPPVKPKAVEAAPAAALRAAPAEVIRDSRPAAPVFTPPRPDTSSYGSGVNGTAGNGAASNGAATNGTYSNGAATNGAAANGTATNGTASSAWSDNPAGSWLVPVARRASPRFRLFCFPFAGGGSAVFRDWGAGLDPSIEVVAIEPPGRLSRINEKPVHDLKVFVDRVIKEMETKIDLPFALFGHCLGGLTMYEVARRLIDERGIIPRHIFASGARAPDTVQDVGPFEKKLGRALMEMPGYQPDLPPYRQPESVFTAMLRRFDMAATERFLSDPDLRRLMLPAVRAEFEMTMNYRFEPTRPWDVPLTCFISRGDPYVSRENVLGWGRFTNERLQIHMRKGSHYSVVEDAPFMQRTITQELLSSNQ